jgi:uncharacterized protein
MPRRIFKRLSRQRQKWKERRFLRPFGLLLDHPVYWALNRRSVTRACALGLFIAFIPFPGHIMLVTLLALLLRLNIPAGIAGVMFTNPFTLVPLFFCAYWLGCRLLSVPLEHFYFELSWRWAQTELLPIWKPLVLGCFVTGTLTAIAGYIVLGGIWHLNLVLQYRRRKALALAKASANRTPAR